MVMDTSREIIVAESIDALAALLQRDPSTLRRWKRKEAGFPSIGEPPFKMDVLTAVRAWVAERFAPRPALPEAAPPGEPSLSECKRRIAVENARIQRLKRLEREGSLVPRELLERGELALIAHVVNRLEEMVESVPADIAPEDPSIARMVLRDWVDRFREDTAAMKFFEVPNEPLNGRAPNPAKRRAALARHRRPGLKTKRGEV